MKSVRLTNSIREQIIKNLMQTVHSKMELQLKKFGKLCDSILMESIDKEILEMDEKYPKLLDKRTVVSFNRISTNVGLTYQSVPVNKWYSCYETENLKLLRENKEIQDFCKKLISLDKEMKSIKNKLSCLLDHINTTKQLKDQFPEAYKIFLKLNNEVESDNSDNLCDSFENVRAALSKFNKE